MCAQEKEEVLLRSGELYKATIEDPTRFKRRIVAPKKGGGKKQRPRDSNRMNKEQGECNSNG